MTRDRTIALLQRAVLSLSVTLALVTSLHRLDLPTTSVGAVTGGPSDPVPVIEPASANKSVILNLNFNNQDQVSLANGALVFGRPPARIANPPLLDVQLKDKAGAIVERYNEWHPLWRFVEDGGAEEGLVIRPSAVGTFPHTFAPQIRTMEVYDIPKQKLLATIDVVGAAVRPFCEQNPTDAICTADVGLTKGDAPDPVYAGTQLTYTLAISNSGPNPAYSVTLVDTLPAGVTHVSNDGGCVQAPVGKLTCGPYLVDPSETRQVKVTVKVDPLVVFYNDGNTVSLTNLAKATNAAGADSQPANNDAQATTTAQGVADLAVTTFNDPNASGVREPGEAGMPATIFIDLNGNGILDGSDPSRITAADGTFTLKGVGAGDFRICTVVPPSRAATSPRCTGVLVAVDGPKVIPLSFGSRPLLPGCAAGTLINTVVAINPVEAPGDPVSSAYYRSIDLQRPGAPSPWTDARLLVQPTGNNPVTYVRKGEQVSNALLLSGVNGNAYSNLVLKVNYLKARQTVSAVVAADGSFATWASPPSGNLLPTTLPTSTFTIFDKDGELYIFGVPKTADSKGFQDVFLITTVTDDIGFITTTASIAGRVANNRIQTIGNTCGDKAESTIFAGTPETTDSRPGALPVNDVPKKGADLNPF